MGPRLEPVGRRLEPLLPAAIVTAGALVAGLAAPDAIASGIRAVLGEVTLARLLVLAALALLLAAARATLRRMRHATRSQPAPPRRLERLGARAAALVERTPWPAAVLALATVAGVGWYALGRALALPLILADELIYLAAARNLAEHGSLPGYGYGPVTPMLDAVAFLLTDSDVGAYRFVQGLNAALVASAAFPAYLLARRALTHRLALAVAALTVTVPWLGYARFAMTEAVFYPVFLLFALALVRALERPSAARQLILAAALLLAVGTRTQAVALAGAVPAAVVLHGLSGRRLRSTLAAFALTWAAGGTGGAAVAALWGLGRWSPLGPYGVLLQEPLHPRGMLLWAAATLTALGLGLGVLAAGAAPLGAAALLRRQASAGERALASTAVASTLALLLTVVVLSVTPYGLGIVPERNLFYAVPLVLACALAWAARGFPRPPLPTAVLLGGFVALPLLTPAGVITPTTFSFKLWTQLEGSLAAKAPIAAAILVGTAVLVRLRSTWPLVAATALAAAGVAAASDYRSDVPREVAPRFGWVDRALAPGERAAVLWIGHDDSRCPAGPGGAGLDRLALYTELLNSRIGPVGHLLADNRARGLASQRFAVAPGGTVTADGAPLESRFVVVDARVELAGSPLALLRASDVGMDEAAPGSALALWRTVPPVRLRRPQAVLAPAAACAPFPRAR